MKLNLERLVEEVEEAKSKLDSGQEHEMYLPKKHGLLDYVVQKYYDIEQKGFDTFLKPTNSLTGGLPTYILWKLPPRMHELLNKTLGYITPLITTRNPQAGIYAGLAYSASELMYSIKTRSGSKLLSGLVGALSNLGKIDKFKQFSDESWKTLESYFKSFNPSTRTA